jgi:site-specific recombinase XerD
MPTLDRAIDTFLLFKEAEAITPHTLAWYATSLARFSTWLSPTLPLAAIRPHDIAEYLVHEQQRGLSSLTVEGSYRALLAFFNWCEYSPDCEFTPSPIGHGRHKAVKRPKVDEPDRDYVSFEEYTSLTTAIDLATWIDYRDWCMIGVMFWCGVRRGELLGMELRDLNFAKGEIRIRHSKARRHRSVFLVDDLTAGIQQYLSLRPMWEGTALWSAYDKARIEIGGPLTATGLRLMLMRRCRRAGIRFLNPHLFRHGFAMAYLNHGVDLKAVGDLMGHSSYKTTEKHYARWIDDPLRKLHKQTAEIIASGND